MSWLHKILGEAPEPDPDEYTRMACEACEGTGWLMSGGRMYAIRGMPTACTSCDGQGWVMGPDMD